MTSPSQGSRPEAVAGRELDALIAERLMGYRWFVSGTSRRRGLFLPNERSSWFDDDEAHGDEPRCMDWDACVRPYSTEMAWAWLVVEKMGEERRYLAVERDADDIWHASFGVVTASAATAPHAICLAALAALDSLSESPKGGETI